jgi:hypothetical protein
MRDNLAHSHHLQQGPNGEGLKTTYDDGTKVKKSHNDLNCRDGLAALQSFFAAQINLADGSSDLSPWYAEIWPFRVKNVPLNGLT